LPVVIAPPSGGNATWLFDAVTMGDDVFRARIAQRAQAKGIGGSSRWLCAAGIHTELGLSGVLECVWSGGLAVLSNGAAPSFVSVTPGTSRSDPRALSMPMPTAGSIPPSQVR